MQKHGFTLIELLLVVLIAGLAVALAVPRFVGSYKGAQLRDAVGTVVRMHRYARSSAVLEQGEGALLFDVAKGTITLISIPRNEEPSGFLDNGRQDSIFADEGTGQLLEDKKPQITEKVERALPKGISIENFVCEVEDQEIDGIFWINYFPNGMCDPYRLSIVDAERNATVRIEVDSVSGRIEVEYE